MGPLGICPICGFDRMIMASVDNCRFDACPKCGFGYGYISKRAGRKKLRNQELWDRIVAEQPIIIMNEEKFTRERILDIHSAYGPADVMKARRETDSVFKYSDKQIVKNGRELGVNSSRTIEAEFRLRKIPTDKKLSLLNEENQPTSE